eukprot:TRINITY_DN5584_c0_g1_i5.p1 TRINITY_DN5584_c0_g1~~TRINITY_DN5584_c0_g1_i5.p1  ORF type:complete len:194 (+),score=67.26 TRINITY_DN5584_c0_g1_i5:244-825(+)
MSPMGPLGDKRPLGDGGQCKDKPDEKRHKSKHHQDRTDAGEDGGRKDSGMDKAHKYKKLYSIKAKELEQERENAKQQTEKAEKLLTANSQLRSELEKAKTQLVEQDKELLDKSMQLSATKGKLLTIERDSSAQRLTSAEGEMKKKMMVELADLKLENQRLSNQLNDQHKKFMDLEAKNTELELKLKHGDPPTN